jgi:hypothetical protein
MNAIAGSIENVKRVRAVARAAVEDLDGATVRPVLQYLGLTILLESLYTVRAFILAVVFAGPTVYIIEWIYGVTLRQAATALFVPLGFTYLAIKLAIDLTPKPPVQTQGSTLACRAITRFLQLGISGLLFSLGLCGSLLLYSWLNVSWMPAQDVGSLALFGFIIGALSLVAGAGLRAWVSATKSRLAPVPPFSQLLLAAVRFGSSR